MPMRTSTERSTALRPCLPLGEGLFARDIIERYNVPFVPETVLALLMNAQHAKH